MTSIFPASTWIKLSFFAALAVGLAIFAGIYLGNAQFEAQHKPKIDAAKKKYDTYELQLLADARTISLKGYLGEGVASKIRRLLEENPEITTLEITSPGGLAHEALAVAQDLEGRRRFRVRAQDLCASACVVVLVSAERRSVSRNMRVGFHAVNIEAKVADNMRAKAGERLTNKVFGYLLSKGVPKVYLEKADELGPDKLYEVSAEELLEKGVITELS